MCYMCDTSRRDREGQAHMRLVCGPWSSRKVEIVELFFRINKGGGCGGTHNNTLKEEEIWCSNARQDKILHTPLYSSFMYDHRNFPMSCY